MKVTSGRSQRWAARNLSSNNGRYEFEAFLLYPAPPAPDLGVLPLAPSLAPIEIKPPKGSHMRRLPCPSSKRRLPATRRGQPRKCAWQSLVSPYVSFFWKRPLEPGEPQFRDQGGAAAGGERGYWQWRAGDADRVDLQMCSAFFQFGSKLILISMPRHAASYCSIVLSSIVVSCGCGLTAETSRRPGKPEVQWLTRSVANGAGGCCARGAACNVAALAKSDHGLACSRMTSTIRHARE